MFTRDEFCLVSMSTTMLKTDHKIVPSATQWGSENHMCPVFIVRKMVRCQMVWFQDHVR